MSSKVDQFLSESGGNNFTETAPRPPVPGEENEKESNGGMSTRSSASSRKSHVSHTSCRSNSSTKGDINPATPRKSNIDKNNANMSCPVQGFDDEMDAPLGFEPEGSAANSPPFTENSTPPCSRWAKSLHLLLEDRDGVQLFRTFLDQEDIGTFSLDFWFACQGLKLKESAANNTPVIKVIYKKYIKSDKLPYLESETKKTILEHIHSGIDLSIFNAAQEEVEHYLTNDAYPAFLKSDLYVQYFARGGESSNSSSGSNSARPVSSGPLPILREDKELEQDDFVVPYNMGPPRSKSYTRTSSSDTSMRPEVFSGPTNPIHTRPFPYHISYAPTSAQDSEIQSLSSQSQDALTDDTRSLTDSSVDGHSIRESRRQRKYLKGMQRRAGQNREMGPFIPRTDRAPKDRTLAEIEPKRFADLLIIKLEKVVKEREKDERVHLIMNQSESILDSSCVSSIPSRNNTATSIVPLLTSSMIDEENADSILEEHCSRIWERSAQQTPSRSPGRHSPRSRSPDRFRKPFSQTDPHKGTSSMPGTLHTKSLNSKKRGEFYSSFDSGMGEDTNNKCSVETHKHIHHHHHHHHERSVRRSKHKLEVQAQQHSIYCWGDPPARAHAGARQKTMSRSHSDNTSNLDSGISMVESVSQYPEVNDPSRTKVLQWILDNETVNRGASAYTDSDNTSSTQKHRAHRSSAHTSTSQTYTGKTCSKKGSGSHINRSASADSCSRSAWVPPAGGPSVMPSQPIVQDPSMPLMPPPNTRVQLEEVKRRIETDNSLISKSFTGPSKDKRPGLPGTQARAPPPLPPRVPADSDTSGENTRNEKQMKKSSGSMNTSSSSGKPDETVIGYYLFGEPIPYRITVPQPHVTLGQLKQLISKRGNFRFFVKTHSRDFDSEVVYEEIKEDSKILPVFDGKVVVKIDKIDEIESPNKSTSSSKK